MPVLALIALGVVCAVLWHLYVPKFAAATVGATVTTVVAYQALGYFVEGAPENFENLWPRALLITGTIAAVISALIGWPIYHRRKAGGTGAL